jgi:RNA polymerase sigma-70 factor (ECF subfamily)
MSDVTPGSDGRADEPAPSLTGSLLQRLQSQKRNEQAWERLKLLYYPTIYRWCRGKGLSPEDAEEVSQKVFVAVWRSVGDFRRNRPGDSFRGWLFTITRNKIRDHLDHNRRQPQAAGGTTALEQLHQVPEPDWMDPSPTEVSMEVQALYQRALELIKTEFTEQYWKAFFLAAVEERSAKEVAEALGMTVGHVYVAKSRVKQRLQEEFGELLG